MKARTTPAVPSGRSVIFFPSRSSKVYISFSTMSVEAPMLLAKSSVYSKTGTRISEKPSGRRLDMLPCRHVRRQDVLHALDRLNWHSCLPTLLPSECSGFSDQL